MDTMNKNKMLAHLRELESCTFTQLRELREQINYLYHRVESLQLDAMNIHADMSTLNESDSNEVPEGMVEHYFGDRMIY